jgi:hypothetical protein
LLARLAFRQRHDHVAVALPAPTLPSGIVAAIAWKAAGDGDMMTRVASDRLIFSGERSYNVRCKPKEI